MVINSDTPCFITTSFQSFTPFMITFFIIIKTSFIIATISINSIVIIIKILTAFIKDFID